MHVYKAFGLTLASEYEMSGLPPGSGPADVRISSGQLDRPDAHHTSNHPYVDVGGADSIFLFWNEVGGALVKRGSEIVFDVLPGADPNTVNHILQGICMGMLLDQRGLFTLHGSAVAVDGEVVVFLGWKGMGKSTTAAAMHAAGFPLISDDIIALQESNDGRYLVVPGVPIIKLWPDSVRASMRDDPEAWTRIYGPSTKRMKAFSPTVDGETLTLRKIYILDYADAESVPVHSAAIPGRDACMQMVTHSYALRFLGKSGANQSHLQQCTRITHHVPVERLIRPKNLDKIDEVVRFVSANAGRSQASSNGAGATAAG